MKSRVPARRRSLLEQIESRILMDVTFNIDTTQGQQPISPYIYGTNHGQASAFTGYTFSRVGGNRWTAYNWTNNASNAGSDWLYQNDGLLSNSNTPGAAVASVIVDVGNHNAPLVLTIPTNGYLAADKAGPVDIDDPNRFTTRFVPEQARKGAPFTLTPPSTGTVYQDEFVNWVKQTYPATQTNPNRPVWYSLDNEPDLWSSTHVEVHPAKATYAEMIQKTIEYASAIKDVSSISLVFGPVNYGWNGMITLQDAPDRGVAGSLTFQQYYLQQIRAAEIQAGRKLLDVNDIHYYSEAQDANNRRVTENNTDAVATAARVQAARSLYDPTYVEKSWITQWTTGGAGIDLLHRMQNDVATYNPGTKIALTEYNFGAGNHISGAIAQAEALGAFGQVGVFAANYWQIDSNVGYAVSAFNMFRNFDGGGSKFGNTSTFASTTSMDQSAIFASVDSADPTRVVLIAINRTGAPLTSHFNVASLGAVAAGQWYALTGSSSAIQNMGSVTVSGGSGFDVNLPAYSVNTFSLTIQTGAVATPAFSPAPGTYASARNVTISTTTPGATIRYTLDGSMPSPTNGLIYDGPVLISATADLKAIAYASGMPNSAIRSGTYTIAALPDVYIYQDSLAAGWDNWSWNSTLNFANTSPVRSGSSIAVTYTGGWAGLSMHRSSPLSTSGYTAVKFWVHGGTGANKSVGLYTEPDDAAGGGPSFSFTAVANTWTEITVPLSAIGNPTQIQRINFQETGGSAQTAIYFDEIRLVAESLNQAPTDLALSATTVPENRPAGSAIGTLSSTDPNAGDTFTYSFVSGTGSADNGLFAIVNGELRTAGFFDYEARISYSIRVRTTDQVGLWYEEAITIMISNLDDPYGMNTWANAWRNVAIDGGGFVTGIITNPTQRDLVYARTDIGGAYRWNPANGTWIPLNDFAGRSDWNLYGVESLATDPVQPNRLYVAAGTYTNSWAGNGSILRSSDYGATWQRADMPFKFGGNENGRSNGERLVVDPNLNSTLFLGTRHNGLWKSTDYGATWNQVTSFPVTSTTNGVGTVFVQFVKSSGTPGSATPTLYAGVSQAGTNLYRSVDGGATWQAVAGQPTTYMPHQATLDSDGSMYITYGDGPGPNGVTAGAVWKLNTNTGAWTNVTPPTGQGGFAGVSLDAQHPGTLVVSTLNRWWPRDDIYRSTNGGATWTSLRNSLGGADPAIWDYSAAPYSSTSSPHWIGDLEIDPFNSNRVMFVTGYGIWTSLDLSAADTGQPTHWSFTNRGLEETAAFVAVSPSSGAQLLSAMGDIDGFRHTDITTPPAAGRFSARYGTNEHLDFAENNPNIVVRLYNSSSGNYGSYSLDNGQTWTTFPTFPAAAGTQGTGKIAVSADGSTFLWAPNNTQVYYSKNRGTTWTLSSGAPSSATNSFVPIADRVNASKFYLYNHTNGQVFVSTDGGVSFAQGASGLPTGGAELRTPFGIEGEVWLPANGSGLYRSTNSGASFARLPVVQEAYLVGFGKAAAGQSHPAVYLWGRIGGMTGFFRSDDNAVTWVRINDDLHQYGTTRNLAGDPRVYGRVYLSTNGRGIVYADLNAAPTDLAISATTLAENRPAGTVVGIFSGTDPDPGNAFTYSLVSGTGSTDNASFTIVGNELRTAASFNYEARSIYSIRVRITDQGGLASEKAFTIAITDIDEIATTIIATSINDGAAQRSMVKKLSVAFAEPVTVTPCAITVKLSSGAAVPGTTITTTNPSADGKTYLLTFSTGSLPDGIYDLLVTAAGVHDLAGNPLTGNYSQRFHRLFGDTDGNKIVNAIDYARLRTTFARSSGDPLFNGAFDYDSNNLINALDLAQFRRRFGMVYSY